MTLARCGVTIEAQTHEGELVVVSIPRDWTTEDALFPPLGVDPLAWVLADAAKRTRAALSAAERTPAATFGDTRPTIVDAPEANAPTFGRPKPAPVTAD